ncbi:hypothetical protein LJY25_05520 [Hymenobacter sp. BT175]|uniref:hypothetical protein n=1 Tax=Hymenobacter translucens TaxID=2886507 RepID=UPI001D0DCDBC|nr:hypothetical protein [Hymenobacter translucens]MCC2545895.1 hypothetical protein [Hymenobacter translucens]
MLPTYLAALLCYGLPGAGSAAVPADRAGVVALVAGLTFLLPALATGLLYKLGKITSLELGERRQRPLPLLLGALSFGAAAFLLHNPARYDALLSQMLVGMTIAVLLTTLITLRWKISAHGVGMGGALGLLLLVYPRLAGSLVVAGAVAAAGAVLWARLRLQAHTPAQVYAGFALGLGTMFGMGLGLLIG